MAWTIIIISPLPAENGVLVSLRLSQKFLLLWWAFVHVDQHVGSCFLLGFRGGQADEVLADACFTLFRDRIATCLPKTRSPYV